MYGVCVFSQIALVRIDFILRLKNLNATIGAYVIDFVLNVELVSSNLKIYDISNIC